MYDPAPTAAAALDASSQSLTNASLRHDLASEKAVEIGIRLQEILGTSDAAQFLKNNVIGIDVALRVLLRPTQRRRT